ncbi:GT4 family glycosyltransferase PelF [Sporolactobacillus putidus]|uniref:Glycosyl transferase n=1 Tax=Sporolactobacillus putidus TaxID=492735 RepID=A0A917W3K0_9BACL|nr:GT4 family glycosyltransferase PelF [Sporolactobacillus putidus]GGL58540.1 glycosyl transferase [Sporolactobacillus putidus]
MKIGLVAEGSYPYVSGGVANWVHMIIQKFPEHDFTIIAVVPTPKTEKDYQYELPSNVIDIMTIPLQSAAFREPFKTSLSEEELKMIKDWFSFRTVGPEALKIIGDKKKLGSAEIFLRSSDFYQIVRESYRQENSSGSFSDYLWMCRSLFLPVIRLLQVKFLKLDLIHSVSTGYGGLLASSISARQNIPFLLTEHGIYSREREEEILQTDWIPAEYKQRWITFFHHLSRQAYMQARDVVTLFGRNSEYQRELGAPPEKLKIIPNGIELKDYGTVREIRKRQAKRKEKLMITAVIRIVPIKDVKTMIYSAKILADRGLAFAFFLLGPDSEEPEYAAECRDLITRLHLDGSVFMEGKVDIKHYLTQTDVLVLTSISEGQPLAVLEGMAAGIPWIVTDVGACRELVRGSGEDGIGPCGFVVPPVSPERVADYLQWYAEHEEESRAMGEDGYRRAEKYYQLSGTIDSYRKLYADGGKEDGGNRISAAKII